MKPLILTQYMCHYTTWHLCNIRIWHSASLVRYIFASVRERLCSRQHTVHPSITKTSQSAAGWRVKKKKCLLRELLQIEMQNQFLF